MTDSVACLGVAGPYSRDVMSKLTLSDMSHEAFKFLNIKDIEVGGVQVRAIRISYTGLLGKCCNLWLDIDLKFKNNFFVIF